MRGLLPQGLRTGGRRVAGVVGSTLILTAVLLDQVFACRTVSEHFIGVFAGAGRVGLGSRWKYGYVSAYGRARG